MTLSLYVGLVIRWRRRGSRTLFLVAVQEEGALVVRWRRICPGSLPSRFPVALLVTRQVCGWGGNRTACALHRQVRYRDSWRRRQHASRRCMGCAVFLHWAWWEARSAALLHVRHGPRGRKPGDASSVPGKPSRRCHSEIASITTCIYGAKHGTVMRESHRGCTEGAHKEKDQQRTAARPLVVQPACSQDKQGRDRQCLKVHHQHAKLARPSRLTLVRHDAAW